MDEPGKSMLLYRDTRFGSFSAQLFVPRAGYHIEKRPASLGDAPTQFWLVESAPKGEKRWLERVAPLAAAHQGLLDNFVALRTPMQARKFANRYGLLTSTLKRPLMEESLSLWSQHVRRILGLTGLLGLMERQDRDALSKVVIWHDDPLQVAIYPAVAADCCLSTEYAPAPLLALHNPPASHIVGARFYSEQANRDAFWTSTDRRRWATGDPFGPALLYLADTLNDAVLGKVHPKLMPFARHLDEGVPLDFEADSLLTSLYLILQLRAAQYHAPQGAHVEMRRCVRPGCKNVFPARGNQQTCEDVGCKRWLRQQRNRRHNTRGRDRTSSAFTS